MNDISVSIKHDNAMENNFKLNLNSLSENIEQFFYKILKNSGFDISHKSFRSFDFLHFVHFSLLQAFQILSKLKEKNGQKLNKEERNTQMMLEIRISNMKKVDPKIKNALNLFVTNFAQLLRRLISLGNLSEEKMTDQHHCYISFFSKITIFLTESYFDYDVIEKTQTEENFICPSILYKRVLEHFHFIMKTRKHELYIVHTKKGDKFLLKVLLPGIAKSKGAKKLKNEYKICSSLSHPGLRKAIKRFRYNARDSVLFEWVDGHALSEIKLLELSDFFKVSREIASALLALHSKELMHLNLSCDHIIVNDNMNVVKIIGCSSATSFQMNTGYLSNKDLSEMDLSCISPELLGRNNRTVDFRSDFYSLGILLYKMLLGFYPFESTNKLKLIHMHTSQKPLSPETVKMQAPRALSDMILKLLNKNAEDRYSTTKGIIHDLDLIISSYETEKQIKSNIILSQHDQPEVLLLEQKLYGRLEEFQILKAKALECASSSFTPIFITGSEGVGKSRLVNEFHQHIIEQGGVFLSGKFDKSKEVPYSALIEALIGFCNDILLEDQKTKERYREIFQEAVAGEGRLLTDAIPNLHLIIGKQEDSEDLFGEQAKRRFIYVLVKFIKAISRNKSLTVLVLEDLHYIDEATHDFLSALIKSISLKNFMFVGTFRKFESKVNHPISDIEHQFKENSINLTTIELKNFDFETTNLLISNTLHLSSIYTYSLTVSIYEKTKGNPLFVNQMLSFLYEQGSIYFSIDSMEWKWDNSCRSNNGKQILDLISSKIKSLDEDIQTAFKYACCLGSTFSLPVLRTIIGNDDGVNGMLLTGMVKKFKGSETMYRFQSDQIHLASQSLLPVNIETFKYELGKKLWKLYMDESSNSNNKLKVNIYVAANLIHDCIENIQNKSELAELFFCAGNKAMTETSFSQAMKYLNKGIELLGNDCWSKHYNISLQSFEQISKAAYSISDYSTMNAYINTIFENATSVFHLVKSYSLLIKNFNDKFLFDKAIQAGTCILDKVSGMKYLDQRSDDMVISTEIQNIKRSLDEVLVDNQLLLREMTDEKSLFLMTIMNDLFYASFLTSPGLFTLIGLRMMHLTLSHGISKYSCNAFCAFGFTLRCRGDKAFILFGKISLKLLKKSKAKALLPKLYNYYYNVMSPFFEPISCIFDPLLKSYKVGMEVGAIDDSSICAHIYILYSFLVGRCLKKLDEEMSILKRQIYEKTHNSINFLAIQQSVLNLTSQSESDAAVLKGTAFDYSILYKKERIPFQVARPFFLCGIIAYLFHDYTTARRYLKECRSVIRVLIHTCVYPYFLFYESLILLSSYNNAKEGDNELKISVQENISKLGKFAETAPMNFSNKVCLLQAELSKYDNNYELSVKKYEKAIYLSDKHGFINEQAIACERFSLFLVKRNNTLDLDRASEHLRKAIELYNCWGAIEKGKFLSNKYHSMFSNKKRKIDSISTSCTPYNLEFDVEPMTCASEVTFDSIAASDSNFQKEDG